MILSGGPLRKGSLKVIRKYLASLTEEENGKNKICQDFVFLERNSLEDSPRYKVLRYDCSIGILINFSNGRFDDKWSFFVKILLMPDTT